jgi:hypothetical protein
MTTGAHRPSVTGVTHRECVKRPPMRVVCRIIVRACHQPNARLVRSTTATTAYTPRTISRHVMGPDATSGSIVPSTEPGCTMAPESGAVALPTTAAVSGGRIGSNASGAHATIAGRSNITAQTPVQA